VVVAQVEQHCLLHLLHLCSTHGGAVAQIGNRTGNGSEIWGDAGEPIGRRLPKSICAPIGAGFDADLEKRGSPNFDRLTGYDATMIITLVCTIAFSAALTVVLVRAD
jgi:hypothetical protein